MSARPGIRSGAPGCSGTPSGRKIEAAAGLAGVYAGVAGEDWERTGIRSNGSLFTVATLGQYGLHDLVHHLWDVGVDLG